MSVRIAMLGVGQRGLQHLAALWRIKDELPIEIVTLVDAREENLEEEQIRRHVDGFRAEGIDTGTDFRAALARGGFDALYVCIPPGRHNGEIIAAAESGVHLFAEKPMSLYLDEAAEMDAAIRRSGVIATAGFNLRYDPRYAAAHRFLADKRVVMATMVSNGYLEQHSVKYTATEALGGPPNRVWTANLEWSGSSVVEAGIHQVDLMRYWCGDVAWVEATYVHRDAEDVADGGDNPYAYRVTLGFESGCIGNLLMSRLTRVFHGDGYEVVLWTHGMLKFEGTDVMVYHYDGPYPPTQPPRREDVRNAIDLPDAEESAPAISRAFIDAVRQKSTDPLRSTFGSSMNSLAAVLAANVSDRLHGERVVLRELETSDRYAPFRRKP